jgi:hypothetical protein
MQGGRSSNVGIIVGRSGGLGVSGEGEKLQSKHWTCRVGRAAEAGRAVNSTCIVANSLRAAEGLEEWRAWRE